MTAAAAVSSTPLLASGDPNARIPAEQHIVEPSQAVTEDRTRSDSGPGSIKHAPTTAPSPQIEGALRDILWALVCVSLPMLVLTATFIGLVYTYKISTNPGPPDQSLSSSSSTDPNAYYVNYSATRLITVSSWTSTVTSFTASFVMALVSYPIAKSYLSRSNAASTESLPTPYQLRLILDLVGGGFGSLWTWIQYCFWRHRSRQPRLLWVAALSLLGASVLSFAILAVDTWLHVTTTTINYDAVSSVSQPSLSYGRSLDPTCDETANTSASGVCIGDNFAGLIYFDSLLNATETLMNLSSINAALPCSVNGQNFAYLAAADPDPDVDFQAKTFALNTQCTPVSNECHLQAISWCDFPEQGCSSQVMLSRGMSYDCGPTLFGGLTNNTGTPFNSTLINSTDPITAISAGTESTNGFFMQLFRKPNFSEPFSDAPASPNPFYFAMGGRVAVSSALADDPEAVANNANADYGFIFSCMSTFSHLEYTMVNGSFAGGTTTPMNDTLASNAIFTFNYYMSYTQNAMLAAFISGGAQSNTSQQFADFLAQRFSESTLSMVSGLAVAHPNLAEQTRERLLVTRLPKAPFFALIVLNLTYALLGIILAVLALASQPRTTRSVQARLSIGGIIAALLEPDVRVPPAASAGSKPKRNTGIEGAFAEYYYDDGGGGGEKTTKTTLRDEGRVLVTDRGGNVAFEKILSPEKEAAVSTTAHHGQQPSVTPASPPSVPDESSRVRRKPVPPRNDD